VGGRSKPGHDEEGPVRHSFCGLVLLAINPAISPRTSQATMDAGSSFVWFAFQLRLGMIEARA
jgi:hypothetical protein